MEDGSSSPAGLAARLRIPIAVLCFAASGALVAWVMAPGRPALASRKTPPALVRAAGIDVQKGSDTLAAARRIAAEWEAARLTLTIDGSEPMLGTRRGFGARIDAERLAAILGAAHDSTSTLRRVHAQVAAGSPVDVPLPIVVDESETFDRLIDRKDAYDRRPRDARVNVRTGEIAPHHHGRVLDVHGTLDALRHGFDRGETQVRAAVRIVRAGRSTEELEDLRLDTVLASYETRYSTLADASDRTFNLRVAAEKVDGLVLMPGETLDFNEVVGERNEANGFRPAPVIAGGELVDGVGGGTCQVAGALHAAAFFAGLPILERRPHSRPSAYIFMGLDAVVAYPQLNLRFENELPFPIALGFTVEGGVARAEIRGAPTGRMVTFVRRIDDVTPYEEREVEDESLPDGVRVLRQRGVPGFRVRRFRVVRDVVSRQAVRTLDEDIYPPTTQVWRVGKGGPAPEGFTPPEGDGAREYTADAYLSVTQGAGVEGTQIIRRAGRSGTPGWTEAMGFPPAE